MDISDDGWIIAYGNTPNTTGFRALLLVPYNNDCLADVNRDCVVNVVDLLTVLADWGTCQPGSLCFADVDCDSDVDQVDLCLVLDAWGGCLGSGCTSSQQVPQSITDCNNWFPDDCYNRCKCIMKMCGMGAISAEECAGYQNVICDPNCDNN